MTKYSFLCLGLCLALSVPAQARERSFKSSCHVQAITVDILENEIHQLNPFDSQILESFVRGRFVATLIGELDPHLLGQGALIVLSTAQGLQVFYEPEQRRSLSLSLHQRAQAGLTEVGMDRLCLTQPLSKEQIQVIQHLVRDVLNLEDPVGFYLLNYRLL